MTALAQVSRELDEARGLAIESIYKYLERFPDGLTLTELSQKVWRYSSLRRDQKLLVLDELRSRGMLKEELSRNRNGKMKTTVIPSATIKKECLPAKKAILTPDEIRKKAAEMALLADELEKANKEPGLKRQLDPVRLEIFQSMGAANRSLDDLIDAMAALQDSVNKIKAISSASAGE